MVNKLIQALIGAVIGMALMPVVVDFAEQAVTSAGPDSTVATLVEIVPVLYVIILVAGLAAFVYSSTR